MEKEEIYFLNQLIRAVEEAEDKLEVAFEKKDYKNFSEIKKFILNVQEKISEILK